MADKADWCDANVRHFIDICKGEIEAGNRPLGFFNRTGWKNVISKHEEKTGQKLTKKQLKNKWDNMKKEYTWFMELKNIATGLGWNEAERTVECSKEWWDEHLAVSTLLSLFIVHFQCFHIVLLANEPFVSFNFRGAIILRKVSNATMGGSENKGRSTLMICIYCLIRYMSVALVHRALEIYPLMSQVMTM